MNACSHSKQTPMSDESGLGIAHNGSDNSPQDEVFDASELIDELQQGHIQRDVHLSGDSGIAESCESSESSSSERRRRTKSDDTEARSSSFRDELKVFCANKARRLRKFADKDFLTSSVRVRSQSIAEEGEYRYEYQSAKTVIAGKAAEKQRRNSDQCTSSKDAAAAAAAATAATDAQAQRKRQPVKQFLENLRFRSRHDTGQSMANSSGSEVSDESQQISSPSFSEKKQRPLSPVGNIVNKFKFISTESSGNERRRRHSAMQAPQALPHPKDLPLDHSFCADLRVPAHSRLRKLSHPPLQGSVQERHKDLFEQLTHSPDIEGQCSIMSPAAMAETQNRSRRMSGSALPVPCCNSRQRAASGSEVQVTENDKYIIFKSRCQTEKPVDIQELVDECQSEPSEVFNKFMLHHKCYDVMPNSSKLLIFDTMLNVKKAFFALVYNGLRAAPLWDGVQQKFIGMLTVTDFIEVLHQMHQNSLLTAEAFESHKISTWRTQLKEKLQPLRWISPEASLLSAARLLLHSRVHRLIVLEPNTGNALFIVTHKRLLAFLHLHQHQLLHPHWLQAAVRDLNVGSYHSIVTIPDSAPLFQAFALFDEHRVSALPVIDSNRKLVDIYSRFDVINLAATKTYDDLNVTIGDALQYRREKFEGVSTCFATDSLQLVMDKLVTAQVHRLVVIDNESHVIGVISLSDVLEAILFQYQRLEATASATGGNTN